MKAIRHLGQSNRLTHGMTKSPEFYIWRTMKARCGNPKSQSYKHYGGRGIKVCDRWTESFSNFLSDMGERPNPELQIDRINNDGDYTPSNCRWATRSEQQLNKRRKCDHS